MIHDLLLPAKLKFFEMVSGKLGAFFRGFQTNKQIVPFNDVKSDVNSNESIL